MQTKRLIKQEKNGETQEFANVLEKYFHIEKTREFALSDLGEIERFDIVKFGNEVISCCVEHNEKLQESFAEFLKGINGLIDDAMDEPLEKAYNLIAFRYLYDILYLRADTAKSNREVYERYLHVLDNEHYFAILEALSKHQSLSQAELARETKLSPQNLSRYLGKLKGPIVTASKMPFDNKRTYYRLNTDFYQYYQTHRPPKTAKLKNAIGPIFIKYGADAAELVKKHVRIGENWTIVNKNNRTETYIPYEKYAELNDGISSVREYAQNEYYDQKGRPIYD